MWTSEVASAVAAEAAIWLPTCPLQNTQKPLRRPTLLLQTMEATADMYILMHGVHQSRKVCTILDKRKKFIKTC
jgi:hypothetical protein